MRDKQLREMGEMKGEIEADGSVMSPRCTRADDNARR